MKNKKKKSTIIIFSIIIGIVLIFVGVLYYITSTVNNYSYAEKKWISNNKDKTIEVYVEKNLPVFTEGGSGVYYDYLNALKADTGLTFDISTTNEELAIKLHNKNTITDKDIVVYKDHFVVIGAEDSVNTLEDLTSKKVGILSEDKEIVSYYLTDYKSINLQNYDTYDELEEDYKSKSVEYMILPMYKYLDEIITEDFSINIHLDGLYSYYCLDFNSEDININSIMTKFYNRWEEKSKSKAKEYFISLYYNLEKYTELEMESITNDDFIVGYIDNLPYEGMISNDFTGLTNTYLEKFSDMSGVTYKYVEYESSKELAGALSEKKIDLALNYYSISNDNYESSRTLGLTAW